MAGRVELSVVAKNQASSVLKQVRNDIRGLGLEAGKAKSSLSDMFNVAGGQTIANGIASISRSLVGLGAEALNTYASFERLTMSLETFSARELMNAGVTSDMATALEMSGGRAQELLSWIEKLAIQSPFKTDDIASAFRTAQAYGFTSDQAMRLTQATVDFAAGAGISGPMMDRITLALGQIAARGKVSAQELNQLSEAGIGARQILAQAFGVSTAAITEMIEKGLVPADVAIEAITQSLEKDFGGAAQRQANTFSGLISSLEDLKSIGLRDFFTGTFQAVQPYLQNFVSTVTDPAVKQSIKDWGTALGQDVARGLQSVNEAVAAFRTGGIMGLATYLEIPPIAIAAINFASQNIEALTGAMLGLGAVFAAGAIVSGIGAVVAALATLTTPIGLITVGAMALGAAWNSNFGGIQEKTQAVIDYLRPGFEQLLSWITAAASGDFSGLQAGLQGALQSVNATIQAFSWSDFVAKLGDWGAYIAPIAWDALITTVDWATFVGQLTWDNAIIPAIEWGTYIALLAWDSVVATLGDWGAYVAALDWSGYISTALDWGAYVAPIAWGEFVSVLSNWGAYITTLDWTTIITTAIDWATWIPALSWAGFITSLEWAAYVVGFAWEAFVSVLDWATVAGAGIDWTTFVSVLTWDNVVKALDWAAYIGAFAWDSFVTKLEWTGTVAKLENWGAYIASIDWTSFVVSLDWKQIITATIDWATWIVALPWNTFVAVLDWSVFLGAFAWSNYISQIDWSSTVQSLTWSNFIASLTDWAAYITALPWGSYISALSNWGQFIGSVTWASFVANVNWPSFIEGLSWQQFVSALDWSSWVTSVDWGAFIAALAWSAFVPSLSWSSFVSALDLSSYIPTFPGWAAIFSGFNPFSNVSVGQNAAGTDNWRGGWTWVGEEGPELLNLPKGSQILSNDESKKMIGQLATGTTTAAATGGRPWPVSGSTFGDLSVARQIGAAFAGTGKSMKEAAKTIKDAMKELEANLRKVPGLFGASQVTDQQMKMAELGIPQNFADDWLRRLTDEVVNGVNWEGVDIKDAALRAGLDPALPAEAILELVTQKWNDKSLFANPANLDLINQDAVKAALEAQAQQAAGEQNLLGLFGVTPEQARTAGTATGTAAGGGVLTGITQSLTTGGAGQQVATGLAAGITPEAMAPVAAQITAGIAAGMTATSDKDKQQVSADLGAQIANAITTQLANSDSLAAAGQTILQKIVDSWATVGNIDIAAKIASAMSFNLGTADAIQVLQDVGKKIFKLVFQGYDAAASGADYVTPVQSAVNGAQAQQGNNNSGTTANTSPTTAPATTTSGGGSGKSGYYNEPVYPSTGGRSLYPSLEPAYAMAGGGDIYVTVNASVASQIDVEQLAYRVATIIKRRRA